MLFDLLQSLLRAVPVGVWVLLIPVLILGFVVGMLLLLLRVAFLAGRHGLTPGGRRAGSGLLDSRAGDLPGFDTGMSDSSTFDSGSSSGGFDFW